MVRLLIGAAAWPFAAGVQPNARIPVIGFLYPPSEADDRRNGYSAALREGLGDLGYVIGENLRVELRYADGQIDRLEPLAAELVGLKVELILTTAQGVNAAHAATTTADRGRDLGGPRRSGARRKASPIPEATSPASRFSMRNCRPSASSS